MCGLFRLPSSFRRHHFEIGFAIGIDFAGAFGRLFRFGPARRHGPVSRFFFIAHLGAELAPQGRSRSRSRMLRTKVSSRQRDRLGKSAGFHTATANHCICGLPRSAGRMRSRPHGLTVRRTPFPAGTCVRGRPCRSSFSDVARRDSRHITRAFRGWQLR